VYRVLSSQSQCDSESDAGAQSDVGWGMAWCRVHNPDERGERDVALSDSDATNAMDGARHSTRMREVVEYIRVSVPVALSTLHTCVVFNITLCYSILHDSIQRSKFEVKTAASRCM
jgi:hypothetical protein